MKTRKMHCFHETERHV